MTGEVPFTTTPVLPVVPLPAPGESLGSWIAVIAGLYGVTLAEYLGRLGIPRRWITPTIGRDLVIRPLPGVIRALQADTGIAKASLLRMTFSGLERDLEEACRRHDVPCAECENETARRAGRPVALLHTWAAWRVVCPHHPPCPGPADLEAGIPPEVFREQVRAIIAFLDRAAFDPTAFVEIVGEPLAPAFSAGAFVRFVYLLNGYLGVRIIDFDMMRGRAEFRIVHTFKTDMQGKPTPLPTKDRNSLVVSLVLGWQLVADPFRTLLTRLRTANPAGRKTQQDVQSFEALIHLLLDCWPGEMLAMPLTAGALSRRGWKGDGAHTALALSLIDHLRNGPDYGSRLAEAHWNHVAWAGVLLSDELIDRRSQRFSGFPVPGPFRYRHVAADSKTAAWVAKVRRDVWKQRNWDRRAGLQRFTRGAPKRTGKTTVKAPSVRTSRLPSSHIEEAVQVALATYGSRPGKLRPGQRRALLRTLSAAAIKHLHQGAWRDIEA